jgi:hypothetical protein
MASEAQPVCQRQAAKGFLRRTQETKRTAREARYKSHQLNHADHCEPREINLSLAPFADALDLRVDLRVFITDGFVLGVVGPTCVVVPSMRPPLDSPEDPAAGADPVGIRRTQCVSARSRRDRGSIPDAAGIIDCVVEPPGDAGPFGTPLVAGEPAPADPAFGVAAAVPVPADEPLAAPSVEAPPPADPPASARTASTALGQGVEGGKAGARSGLVRRQRSRQVKSPFARQRPLSNGCSECDSNLANDS